MPDSSHTILVLIGGVLLVIGLLGGGIEISDIRLPRMASWLRAITVMAGLFFMGLGLYLDPQVRCTFFPDSCAIVAAPPGEPAVGATPTRVVPTTPAPTQTLKTAAQSAEEATQVRVQPTPTSDPPVSTPLPPTPLALAPTLTQTPMPTATAMPTLAPTNTLSPPTPTPFDCKSVVITSRPVEANETGLSCWLKLYDGASTTVSFNTTAQMTYSKMDGGNTVYFYIAAPGDVIDNVKGATIRPLPHVERHYGSLEDVKQFEIQYHSPGFPNGWVACLRDANNGDAALNSVCPQ